MSFLRRTGALVSVTAMCFSSAAVAQRQFQDLDELDGLIATSLGARAGEVGGATQPLDRRLRLIACTQTINVSTPQNGSVIVACGETGWRLRVATRAPEVAQSNTESAVSDEPIVRRGDEIQLVVMGTGFVVSTRAVCDQNGRVGDRVRVRIPDRNAPVYGTVLPDGRIRL